MGKVKDVLCQFAELVICDDLMEQDKFLDALSQGVVSPLRMTEPITLEELREWWECTGTIPGNLTLDVICQILRDEYEAPCLDGGRWKRSFAREMPGGA